MSIVVKYFDLQLGIDIYMYVVLLCLLFILYIGLVLDLFDYIFFIGFMVKVNGVYCGIVGIGGLDIYILLGVWGLLLVVLMGLQFDGEEIFMGSCIVLVDGELFLCLVMFVLDCNLVGMINLFWVKKLKKLLCVMLLFIGLNVVIFISVKIGGLFIVLWIVLVFCVVFVGFGKLCKSDFFCKKMDVFVEWCCVCWGYLLLGMFKCKVLCVELVDICDGSVLVIYEDFSIFGCLLLVWCCVYVLCYVQC